MGEKLFLILLAVCAVVFVISLFAKKGQLLGNFILRSILGIVAIYFVNTILSMNGVVLSVGINGLTILLSGLLGVPGLALLYGISYFVL
ncbi:pro-sigmaK processing inhibitor BofA family protein [Anaerolentibacter hominis]|uniref:pro-sigmaK processing inhibitor BofA family protein n=1 Tax=Anaerolentibacter hominis TaxID=3079009 RepID=UPI0031B82FB4